jgi:glucose/arabinose dehydrogenase
MKTLLALALVALAVPARAGTPEPGFADTSVISGLSAPTAIAFLPDGTMLVTELGGDLLRVDGPSMTTTLTSIPVCNSSEMGLLGIAIDPNYATNGFVYLYRTKPPVGGCNDTANRFNQVVRVTVSGNTAGSLTELLTGIRTDNGNHDGGVLRVGPDSKLYVGAGDSGLGDNVGGPGSATNPYAQDLTSLNGKVLRINLDGTIPSNNPFVGMGSDRGEVWAYGFRNPFRMSFDDGTGGSGKLWIGDVGDLTVEEIDIGAAGGNYSWPRCEGNLQGPPSSPVPCVFGTDVAPVFTYLHSSGLGTCLIGGAFAGSAFGAQAGNYVFGDCTASTVHILTVNGTRDGFTGAPALVSSSAGVPTDFVRGPDGAIYYTAEMAGEIRRLAVSTPGADALLTGKSLTLKDNPTRPSSRSVAVDSVDPSTDLGAGAGSGDDPTMHGGSLRVVSTAGGFDNTYPMPASSWSYDGNPADGKGYRYKDAHLVNGPIKSGRVRNGKLIEVTGKGSGLGHSLAVSPDPTSAVLTTGTKKYCLEFGTARGSTITFTASRKFSAKSATAPGACPP